MAQSPDVAASDRQLFEAIDVAMRVYLRNMDQSTPLVEDGLDLREIHESSGLSIAYQVTFASCKGSLESSAKATVRRWGPTRGIERASAS